MGDAHDSRDPIGQLVKLAGRRPLPDPARTNRAREAARAEWTHLVGRRRRLLNYLQREDLDAYRELTRQLGLRR